MPQGYYATDVLAAVGSSATLPRANPVFETIKVDQHRAADVVDVPPLAVGLPAEDPGADLALGRSRVTPQDVAYAPEGAPGGGARRSVGRVWGADGRRRGSWERTYVISESYPQGPSGDGRDKLRGSVDADVPPNWGCGIQQLPGLWR